MHMKQTDVLVIHSCVNVYSPCPSFSILSYGLQPIADHLELQFRELPGAHPAIQPSTPVLCAEQTTQRILIAYSVSDENGKQVAQVLRQPLQESLYETLVLDRLLS